MDYLGGPESELPDLILLDLNLPRKNGREVLTEIKDHERLRRIPIVILTTSSSELDVRQTYQLRANCFFTKPADLDQFIHIIHAIQQFWLEWVTLPHRTEDEN